MVGAFHGHAHNCLCQLDWHPAYIEGLGNTEGEGCEHIFLHPMNWHELRDTRHDSTGIKQSKNILLSGIKTNMRHLVRNHLLMAVFANSDFVSAVHSKSLPSGDNLGSHAYQ
jgi:hypothetical protein